jgi:HAAS domain-containing protein
MTSVSDADRLVDSYLLELKRAAEPLPESRRTELIDDVTAHIAEARARGTESGPEIREILARLGKPAEIAQSATDGLVLVDRYRPRVRGREVVTLLLLLFGGFVFLGWLAGAYLLWTSDRWQVREKLLGTLVWPFGFIGAIAILRFLPDLPGALGIVVGVAIWLAPVVMLGVLLRRAQPKQG